jgi:hypothetical protein
MKNLMLLIRHARLVLQEIGPYMALMMLPGGYLIAVSAWIHSYWPINTVRR